MLTVKFDIVKKIVGQMMWFAKHIGEEALPESGSIEKQFSYRTREMFSIIFPIMKLFGQDILCMYGLGDVYICKCLQLIR